MDKHGLNPLRSMGQNFLIDKNVIEKMVSLVDPDSIVIEVGPGLGALTFPVASVAKEVIAIEKDKKIAQILEEEIASLKNVRVIKEDILKFNDLPNDYVVLSNLPFYITSIVIRKFLESNPQPKKMVLMLQREVAKRICSLPPEMNLLALSVQFYAEPKIVFPVSKNSFWPRSDIDCSILTIENFKTKGDPERFFRLARAGFSHPRAQLLNNLSNELRLDKDYIKTALSSLGIDPRRRAETLNLEEWLKLSQEIN